MGISDRIRQVRSAAGLTMDKFGALIGIKKASISLLESGKSKPSKQTLISICREFNVCERWLLTGEGPMRPEDDEVSLDDLIRSEGVSGEEAALVKKLVMMYCALRQETRQDILARFDEYFGTPKDTPKEDKLDIDAEVEAYRQALIAQRAAEAASSASGTEQERLA